MAAHGKISWAWLGDMELDDTILGLGAAGIFPTAAPVALGFLVNSAHCAETNGNGGFKASAMYHEKRTFLKVFFADCFFTVLDRYAEAGKGRDWAGSLTAQQLEDLGGAYGLDDELGSWLDAVIREQPAVLHLLISGPLLGRGEELCAALASRFLAQAVHRGDAQLVLWMYAGTFNLMHSSSSDRQSIRRLIEDHSPRVSVVETTLKMGAWLANPPQPFWGSSCPVAWTLEHARRNPIGFDISTDIQSLNTLLEEYSSHTPGAPRRGLHWVLQRIAEGLEPTEACARIAVLGLLQRLEANSLATSLTVMVPPSSSSMARLREVLPPEQVQFEAAYQQALLRLEEYQAAVENGHEVTMETLAAATQEYANLYRGPAGSFLEAGCTEFFPPEKPYSGPRLDKRCILRCMSQARLQGGPTADLLILLALLLFLEEFDAAIGHRSVEQSNGGRCPAETRSLFHLDPGMAGSTRVFTAVLRPEVVMDASTKSILAPLVDLAIDMVVQGGIALGNAGRAMQWGRLHDPPHGLRHT